MLPRTRHRTGPGRRLLAATLLVLAAAACTDRPTEPAAARHVRAGLEDKEGNSLLVVGSSVRGIALLEVLVEGEAVGDGQRYKFENERPESDEAWGGIAVPHDAKVLVTLRGYDIEGRERFVGQVPVLTEGDTVRQVRGPVTLLTKESGEARVTTVGKEAFGKEAFGGEAVGSAVPGSEAGDRWPEAPVVYAGSYRTAFESRGIDEKSGAYMVAAWAHDATGERWPISPDDIKAWLLGEVGRLEIVHDERELLEVVLALYPPVFEREDPDPKPLPGLQFVVCVAEQLTCGVTFTEGYTPPPPAPVLYRKVVARDSHTCALRTSGLAMCWGADAGGVLAGGPASNHLAPFAFQDIDTHVDHGCGVTVAGEVLCWGTNRSLELGRRLPVGVVSDERPAPIERTASFPGAIFTAVTTGRSHSCGLTTTGTIWCWGSNAHGQLGNGMGGGFSYGEPTQVQYAEAFTQVDAGDWHTCGVTVTQAVICWGDDRDLQTGDAPEADVTGTDCWDGGGGMPVRTTACRKVPARVGTRGYLHLSADGATTCAIRNDRQALCWGRPIPATSGTASATPVSVAGSSHRYIAVGLSHACLLSPENTGTQFDPPTCWGANHSAQLGGGYASVVGTASPSFGMRSMGLGHGYTCAISRDQAQLWCWGRTGPQLGFANTSDIWQPTAVTVF